MHDVHHVVARSFIEGGGWFVALLGQRTLARQRSDTVLTLANQDDVTEEQRIVAYVVLGRVHWVEGRYLKALGLVWQALYMDPPWSSPNGKLLLAKTWETLRQWPQQPCRP